MPQTRKKPNLLKPSRKGVFGQGVYSLRAALYARVWTGEKIADLVVRLGLGDWVAARL